VVLPLYIWKSLVVLEVEVAVLEIRVARITVLEVEVGER
jgi:hypothetical protein